MDLGHWNADKAQGNAETAIGFVYRITDKDNGRFYIGQKKLYKTETRPPLKGKVRKRKIIKESDWRTYCGSCNELKAEIQKRRRGPLLF